MNVTNQQDYSPIQRMLAGLPGLAVIIAVVAGSTFLINSSPRSLAFRLIFMLGLFLIFYIPQRPLIKYGIAAITLLILVPFLGIKSPFLLEIGFQVCAFATLAIGLNIVVGFAGLLDLGYVAFYAVGAYLWGIFGSQHFGNSIAYLALPQSARSFPMMAISFGSLSLWG